MNILILNQYALPSGSAGITRHGDLARVLVKRAHKVTIIASSFDYLTRQQNSNTTAKLNKETHHDVNFLWLKTTPYQANDGKRVKSMLDYTIKAFLQGLSLEDKPDIVIASSPHLLTGLTGIFLSCYYRIPFIFEIRDMWPLVLVELGALKRNSFSYKILVAIEKFIYKKAHKIFTIPALAYKRLESLGIHSQKCLPIPNGILVDDNQSIGDETNLPSSLIKILEQCQDKKTLMYTGSFGGAHDLHSVIQAANYLKENLVDIYNEIKIIFIGSGRLEKELKEIAELNKHSNIYFHPPIEKKIIKTALHNADVLLMPLANISIFEYGLSPNKLYDYLEAAKPIIISSPTYSTIVDEIQAGIQCRAGQPEELAKAIELLISMPEKDRKLMGERGRDYVIKFHDWEEIGEKVEKVLLETIQKIDK